MHGSVLEFRPQSFHFGKFRFSSAPDLFVSVAILECTYDVFSHRVHNTVAVIMLWPVRVH